MLIMRIFIFYDWHDHSNLLKDIICYHALFQHAEPTSDTPQMSSLSNGFSNLGEFSNCITIWNFEKSQNILDLKKIHVVKHANADQ